MPMMNLFVSGSVLMLITMTVMIPITVTGILLSLYVVWCIKRYFYPQYDKEQPPYGSFNWPIIGVMFRLIWNRDHLLDMDVESHDRYGHTISFDVIHVSGISTCHPDNIVHVVKNIDDFPKGRTMIKLFRPFLGHGIFAVNGALWHFQRKKASRMFRKSKLVEMKLVFDRNLDKLSAILDQAVESRTLLDLQDLYMRFTMDSIGEIALGMNLNSLDEPKQEFCNAFDWLQVETDRRGMDPLRKYFTFWRYRKALNVVDKFVYELIAQKRLSKTDQDTDFISMLMDMKDDNNNPLSDRFLRDIVLNFMIAGRDTTSILLTWMSYMLYEHRDVELKLLDELRRDPASAYEDLPYLRAVIDETLRLYPPVPVNFKQAQKDGCFPAGNYKYRRGQEIQFSAYTVHRNEEFWGPDAREFKPERWLQENFRQNLRPGQYIPFHYGPRKCLGFNMARIEAAIVMGSLLARYEFRPQINQQVSYKKGLTMPMKDGYWVRVYHRFL